MVSPVAVAITIAVLVLVLVAMAVGWRRRGSAQRGLVLADAPADVGTVVAQASGLYLATTFAGRPLERVVAGGLGFRARCRIAVTDRGVLVDRDGAAPLFLAAEGLRAGTATWTIDRTVEPDGLLVLGWDLPDGSGGTEAVESSFRLAADDQRAVRDAALAVTASSTQEVSRADP